LRFLLCEEEAIAVDRGIEVHVSKAPGSIKDKVERVRVAVNRRRAARTARTTFSTVSWCLLGSRSSVTSGQNPFHTEGVW
jgi:hypothetical protein